MFDGFYRQPPVEAPLRRAVEELKVRFPQLKCVEIGKSVLGCPLYGLELGETAQTSLFVGGVHGMEWITTLLLFRFLEDLLEAAETGNCLAQIDLAEALSTRSILVVPCLNPDGIGIATQGPKAAGPFAELVERTGPETWRRWQANAHGVDLNHNFDAGWNKLHRMEQESGILGPGPTRYGGTAPHSEPETKALVRLCETRSFRQAYALHTQGEEIYWKYGSRTPARAQLMGQILACTSGYRLSSPEGLASHGGFKDWFIQRFGRPGFTIEAGRGENPLPAAELEPLYARLLEMLLLAILL